MGDKSLALLCDAIRENESLTVLNLSKNNITDRGVGVHSSTAEPAGTGLCKIIRHCKNLKGLFLHYNRILGPGGQQLAKSITHNKFLKVFDISFNQICGGVSTRNMEQNLVTRHEYARAWAECFRRNTDLIHVDISHNNLRTLEMEVIAEGLKSNHTILGIHIMGNEAEIDNKGFVEADNEKVFFQNRLLGPQLMTRINPNFASSTGVIRSNASQDLKASDNCWICEGLRQFEFGFEPGVCSKELDSEFFKQVPPPKLYLHLEQDDFKPDLMMPDDAKSPKRFSSVRMIKPNRDQKYFFSVNGRVIAANFKPKESAQQRDMLAQKKMNEYQSKKIVRVDEDLELDMRAIKEFNLLPKVEMELDPYEPQKIVQMKTKPRLVKTLGAEKRAQTPWMFKKSAFRTYKPDTRPLLDKCFDYDWSFIESKVEYLIKDQKDIELSKKYLRANYKVLRDAYKLTAGQSSEGHSIMSISTNFFSVLM